MAAARYTVAGQRAVTERGLTLDAELVHAVRREARGQDDGVPARRGTGCSGSIALADAIRPESAEAVAELKRRGIRVAMLTGDTHEVGRWVAGQLGLDEVFAEVLPGRQGRRRGQAAAGRRPGGDGR